MTATPTPAERLEEAGIRPLRHFDGARDLPAPRDRLDALRRAARKLREDLLAGPRVLYYESFPLVRVPYPTRYGLLNAYAGPCPWMHIVNRMFAVQYRAAGRARTLLISPSDVDANAETPFFKRLKRRMGPLGGVGTRLMSPRLGSVESSLEKAGLSPAQVDFISYDHLHTQDLRRWLGTRQEPGVFPNARLLVMRQEWESARGLVAPQLDWYCPRGTEGIDPARVVLLDGDVLLGDGVALVRTPGHTEGNHSFVVHVPEGLFVTSENGVGPDAWAPAASSIPGLRRFARETGMDVVLNGNTLEIGVGQYLSMVQERELAGTSRRHPDFYNTVASSEMAPYWLFPGISPTFSFGETRFGSPVAGAASPLP